MSDQPVIDNESNLLQSTVQEEKPAIQKPSGPQSFDEMPIGGKKFDFSEYPEEGDVKVPPKKPFKPRNSKQPKKNQSVNSSVNPSETTQTNSNEPCLKSKENQNSNNTTSTNFDEIPIGGKKFDIPEFPPEDQPPREIKKPVKPKLNRAKKEEEPKKQSDAPIASSTLDQKPLPTLSGNGNFDQQPIGKSNFNISQFPQNDQAPVETQYTLVQKLKSKAVKLKMEALEELVVLIENDPEHPDIYEADMHKFLKQTNPGCLQRALICFKMWVIKEKPWGDDEAKLVIESGFVNGKGNSKKIAVEIIDLMYEKKTDCVEMTILVGMKGKVAKNIAGYISITNELLAIYGITRMKNLKPYLPEIIGILNREKNSAVKTEGLNILKEAYKWLSKQVADAFLKDLKDNFKKDLDTFWEEFDKDTIMKAPKALDEGVNLNGPKKKMDAYELADPVDVFKKYNEKFSDSVIKEEKWSQKVSLMKDFINAASVPKILHTTDHRHINEMIRRLINHSNFNVVIWDLKILGVLAKGIRKPFAPMVRSLFSNVISKFREKKTQMIDETFNTLNQFNYCISIEDVLDDIKQGLGDKVPGMKINLMNWIGKVVQQKIQEKDQLPDRTKEALRNLFPIFEKLMTDGVAEVRASTAKNIGKLKILLGDNFFVAMDGKMNRTMTEKINEAKSKTTVKKVSREKDQKQTKGSMNGSKLKNESSVKQSQNIPKGKVDISEEVQSLIPKMNHSDWQKRKQSAEHVISLLGELQGRLSFGCTNDLLSTLKTRIADPNKQLIKTFVYLTGLVFEIMNEKEVKGNAKNFIYGLADGLSDKMQANRREIHSTLNKIGSIYGKENLLNLMSAYLDTDKDSRIQVINLIIENEEFLQKADIRDYPKGIIKCLTDRNREIRNLGEKLFERVHEKLGVDVFRNLSRNQRPAIAKDLNAIFDKYDGKHVNASMISKGVSPPRMKGQPPSGKKTSQRSVEKSSINQKSFDKDLESEEYYRPPTGPRGGTITHYTNASFTSRTNQSFVEGDDYFAPLKVLSGERVQRQEKDEKYPWICDYVKENQEDELTESISSLIKHDLAKRMLSLDYKRVLDAASQIIKICKEIAYQNELRQIYDLLLKWVFLKLWGGNPSIQSIIEILPPIMSILEKKRLALNDNQVDLILAILREYFISAYMNDYQVSESLYTITKCLIVLSSGERLLKKLLKQFNVELSSIHRSTKRETTTFYRDGLSRLIKNQLMEYIGNEDTLEEASHIKELKTDPEFLASLYRRFHENVLKCFGFKAPEQERHEAQHHQHQPQQHQHQAMNERQSFTGHAKIARKGTNESLQSKPDSQNPPKPVRGKTPVQEASMSIKVQTSIHNEIDLNQYSMPHPASPLGKHLSKLIPPNDATVSFFTHLLNESGEKISNQLITHAKIIFGSILKSIIMMMDNRGDYAPDKIINQINLLQQAIKCKNIINNVGELLFHGTKFALTQLVYEDENKSIIFQDLQARGFEYRADQFIKVINGVMLRILENACPQETVNILLRLLNFHSMGSSPSQKTIYLIIKCLTRVATNYMTDMNERRTQEFLSLLNEYLNIINLGFPLEEFNPMGEKLKPEENVLRSLKNILTEIIKYYGEEIWTYYQNSLVDASFKDDYIPSFLESMGIVQPENIQTQTKEDQHLKLINDLLSKTKTFDSGITELKKYLLVNGSFSPVEYFNSRGFDQRFIMMVMTALEGRTVRRTPTKRQIREEKSQNSRTQQPTTASQTNIQDKIKKLKMRFQEVQPKREDEVPSQQPVSTNSSTRVVSQPEDRGEERAQEIKRRIDEMKNRMNNNSRGR